ncbi:peroxiredoxin [Paracoccus sp. (in: a-proteobacteria)]|uniref:peroxiredoxin n=1 Tax=Paracoccus sp. TaxID=267 RepID=UPI00321FA613
MSIAKGDKLPAGQLMILGANGPEPVDAAGLSKGLVVIFGLPGAYTPPCTSLHMPSFVKTAEKLRAKGVARVVCIAVNDPFVADRWAGDTGAKAAGIEVLADADGSYTRALGMNIEAEGWIKGRSKRYAMIVEDGKVTALQLEEAPGTCSVSSGESVLALL